MVNQKKWDQQILEAISDMHKATLVDGSTGTGDIFERPSIDVYEYTPHRGLDQESRYTLIGPEWSIIQQTSLLKAQHDILGDRLGFTIDEREMV